MLYSARVPAAMQPCNPAALQPCSPAALQPYASRANSLQPAPPTHALASATMLSLEVMTQAPLNALGLLLP